MERLAQHCASMSALLRRQEHQHVVCGFGHVSTLDGLSVALFLHLDSGVEIPLSNVIEVSTSAAETE